ncbi:MAG: hypothetical protein AVO35_00900 [Candidatus Aegiribacteria sp. MLS_C]|nr:MAG: hypothetical protein AVO35_00900 [Candidatus Aegiribacteria sp. MLS_C]
MTGGPIVLESVRIARKGWTLAEGEGRRWLLRKGTSERLGLGAGSIVEVSGMDRIAIGEQLPAARSDAEKYAVRAAHTCVQLRDYLRRRGYLPDVIEEISRWAEESGLVDDRRYAEAFLLNHSDRSPMGNHRIRMELGRRGIDPSIVGELLEDRDMDGLRRIAIDEVRRRYGGLEREKALRRAAGYLSRRGFPFGTVRRILDEALGTGEDD